MTEVIWIEREDELAGLAHALERCGAIGLDTEFMRERTFFPGLCLLQLAAGAQIWCVDTLRCGSLDPLVPALTAPGCPKIIHSARQDLEAFYLNVKRVISPIFDTQIAAGCIGLKPQIGYADLVKTLLEVSLPKGQTRTDWSRRPLTAAQLEYAADDVAVLERGRGSVARAAAGARPRAVGDRGLPRARGPLALRARSGGCVEAAALLAQAAARDARARQGPGRVARENCAPQKSAARLGPRRRGAIQDRGERAGDARGARRHPVLPATAERGRWPRSCFRHCATARAPRWTPRPPRICARRPEQKALADRLAGVVDAHAAALAISSEILATRGELKALAMGSRDVAALKGWRARRDRREIARGARGEWS